MANISEMNINGVIYPIGAKWENIINKPATLEEYGITNVYNKETINEIIQNLSAESMISIADQIKIENENDPNNEIDQSIKVANAFYHAITNENKSIIFIPNNEDGYILGKEIYIKSTINNPIKNKIIFAESNDVIIKAIPTSDELNGEQDIRSIFCFEGCKNIHIINATFDGNNKVRRGILFKSSTNMNINNITIKNIGHELCVGSASGIWFHSDCSHSSIVNTKIENVNAGLPDSTGYIFASGIGFNRVTPLIVDGKTYAEQTEEELSTNMSRYITIDNVSIDNIGYHGDNINYYVANSATTYHHNGYEDSDNKIEKLEDGIIKIERKDGTVFKRKIYTIGNVENNNFAYLTFNSFGSSVSSNFRVAVGDKIYNPSLFKYTDSNGQQSTLTKEAGKDYYEIKENEDFSFVKNKISKLEEKLKNEETLSPEDQEYLNNKDNLLEYAQNFDVIYNKYYHPTSDIVDYVTKRENEPDKKIAYDTIHLKTDGDGIYIVNKGDSLDERDQVPSYYTIKNSTITNSSKRAIKAVGRCIDIINTNINVHSWSTAIDYQRPYNSTIKNTRIKNTTYSCLGFCAGNGIVIDGCSFTGGGPVETNHGSGGIVLTGPKGFITGKENIIIKNCIFDNMCYPILAGHSSSAERQSETDSLIIENCHIKHFFGDSVIYLDPDRFSSANKIIIKGLTFLKKSLEDIFKENYDFYSGDEINQEEKYKIEILGEDNKSKNPREFQTYLEANEYYLLKTKDKENKKLFINDLLIDCDKIEYKKESSFFEEYISNKEPYEEENDRTKGKNFELKENEDFVLKKYDGINFSMETHNNEEKRVKIYYKKIETEIEKNKVILKPKIKGQKIPNSTSDKEYEDSDSDYITRYDFPHSTIHLKDKIVLKKGEVYTFTINNNQPKCFDRSAGLFIYLSGSQGNISGVDKNAITNKNWGYISNDNTNSYTIEISDFTQGGASTNDYYEVEWISIFPNMLHLPYANEDNYIYEGTAEENSKTCDVYRVDTSKAKQFSANNIELTFSITKLKKSYKDDLNFVNPEKFGAKGNGINDDSYAIQKAINYAIKYDIPFKGTSGAVYCIKNPIDIKFNTSDYKYGQFDFQGAEIRVKSNPNFEKYAISFYSGKFNNHNDVHSKVGICNLILSNAIEEINIDGTLQSIYQELVHTGLYIKGSRGAIFEKINLYNFRRGIFMTESGESIIKDCTSRRDKKLDLFDQLYIALKNNKQISVINPFEGEDSNRTEELRDNENNLLTRIAGSGIQYILNETGATTTKTSYVKENIINDFTINLTKTSCVGFEITCADAFIENCVAIDHVIGIKIGAGDNKIHGCHPWNMSINQLASSCCFMTSGNNYFTNNTCDRFHIGFYCRYNIPNFFTNTLFTNQSLNKNDNIAKENYCWYLDPSYAEKTSGHVVKAINTHVTGNRKSEKRSLRWCNSQALLINDTNTTGYILDGYIPKKISDGKLSKIQSINHIALNYKEISEDLIYTQYLNLSYNNETKIFSTSFKTDNDLKTRFISINRNPTTLQSYFDLGKKYLISFKYILNVDKSNSSPEKVETLPAVRVLFKPANGSDRSLGMGSFLRYYTKDTSSFKLSPSEQNNFKTWYNIIDLPKEQGQYIFQIMREYNSNEYDISFSIKDIQIYELPSELPQYLFENGWSYANRLYNFCYPKEEDNNELTLQNEAYNNIQKNIEFYDNDNSNTYDILDNNNTLSDTSGKEKYIIKFDYKITIKNDGNFPRNSFIQIFTDNNVAVENKITSKSGTFYGVFSKSNTSNIQVKKTEENNGTEIKKIEIKNLYIQKIQFDLNTTINTDIIDKILEYQSEINNNTKKIKLIKDEDINNYSFTSLKYPLNFNLLSINDTQNDSLDHDYYHVGYDAMGRTQVKSLCDAENKENGIVVSQKKIYAKVNFQNKKSGLINFLVANGGQQFTPILNEQNKYIIENGENSQDYVLISTNKDGEEEVQRGSSFCLFETRYQGNNNLTRYFNSSNTFKMTDGIANQYTFSNGSTGQKIESESKDTSSVQHTLAVAYEGNRDVIINILPNTKGSVRHTEADGKTLKNYEDDERDIVQINSFNLLDEEDSFNSHVINSGDFIPVYNNGQIYAIKRGVEPPEENEYLPTIAYSLNNDIYFKDENNYITSLELSDFSQNLETSIINNLGLKENLSNKVQEINENSTDIEYPSAAAVYQLFESNQESPSESDEGSSIDIVQDIDENSSDSTVPSAKAVWDLSIDPLSTKENLSNKVDEININDIHNDEYYPTVDAIINYINPSIIQDIITDYLDTHLLNYINNDICEDSTFRQNIQNIINSNSSGGGSNNSGE